ncbi:MAG: glycerol-3-phosphate responsive antiterminator [Armatimonadota bacterium]|nr:glycerol-3-phosphate responsive antiterminator [Armatimonadota bacterium]MDR7386031.1 glycerol-3-phosphate responsive antiterminator [Armatimonadota bacterium]MDR7389536.1 glycerol-3-phosphate responsive antiterminator [Armatimonadota bacterium]MDR7392771.1 glycerol-3-phosphate responsive antiterminator [Armatimonadota bacterium]MDR7397283.1 glycerol-3-phosphate responsive antiterminator [Armatimonadota bacterium]
MVHTRARPNWGRSREGAATVADGHTSAAVEALLARLRELPVVPAVRSLEDVEEACRRGAAAIFFFKGDVFGLREALPRCGDAGIPVYVHLDLVEGVGKDAAGIRLLRELGAAGVVSTRGALLREARAAGLLAIHRVFMVDSEALRTGTAAVRASDPDLVEVLPGLAVPYVIRELRASVPHPVIGAGLVTQPEQVAVILRSGAVGVSASARRLWGLRVQPTVAREA